MTSMLLATIVQAAIMANGAEEATPVEPSYAEARRTTTETGKPLVVMVSTDWCPPCQVMKKTILPRVRERGLLRKVAFAVVNPDRNRELAEEITGGGPIPQLVMFHKTDKGYERTKLVGGQSVETVEEFIKEGLAQDKASKEASKKSDSKKDAPAHTADLRNSTSDADDDAQHG